MTTADGELFEEPHTDQMRHFLNRIEEATRIPDERRDDLGFLRQAVMAARAFAKAGLLVGS